MVYALSVPVRSSDRHLLDVVQKHRVIAMDVVVYPSAIDNSGSLKKLVDSCTSEWESCERRLNKLISSLNGHKEGSLDNDLSESDRNALNMVSRWVNSIDGIVLLRRCTFKINSAMEIRHLKELSRISDVLAVDILNREITSILIESSEFFDILSVSTSGHVFSKTTLDAFVNNDIVVEIQKGANILCDTHTAYALYRYTRRGRFLIHADIYSNFSNEVFTPSNKMFSPKVWGELAIAMKKSLSMNDRRLNSKFRVLSKGSRNIFSKDSSKKSQTNSVGTPKCFSQFITTASLSNNTDGTFLSKSSKMLVVRKLTNKLRNSNYEYGYRIMNKAYTRVIFLGQVRKAKSLGHAGFHIPSPRNQIKTIQSVN